MRYHPKSPAQKSTQQGITLIEALVALLILALGVLGLAQVQVRMLVETRTTNARATAIRLIADLGERIRFNAVGAQSAAGTPFLSPYSDQNAPAGQFPMPSDTPPATACDPASANNLAHACTPARQAAYDVWAWRREVADALMHGVASIWQVSPRQLQVIVAWQRNENTNTTPTGDTADRELAAPLHVTSATDKTTHLCPAETICHVDFIDIPPPR